MELYLEFGKNVDWVPAGVYEVMDKVLDGRYNDAQNVEDQTENINNGVGDVASYVPDSIPIVHYRSALDMSIFDQLVLHDRSCTMSKRAS